MTSSGVSNRWKLVLGFDFLARARVVVGGQIKLRKAGRVFWVAYISLDYFRGQLHTTGRLY